MAAESLSKETLRNAIKDILQDAELSELTSRIVRSRLEEKFSVSLKERKKEVDALLMQTIQEKEAENTEKIGEKNNAERSDEESEISEKGDTEKVVHKASKKRVLKKSPATPSKRSKPISSAEVPESDSDEDVDDEKIARKLHENERGLRARKQSVKKAQKTPQKKEPSGTKGKTGFGKLMVLSPELAAILGQDKMSRSDVVKGMWAIIKERNLMDPKDKRFHICDDQLLKVFGTKRVKSFSMMKYLKHHVKDPSLIA